MDAAAVHSVETPSGKDQGDENFPVASFILSRDKRLPVKRFYDFARAADDIADNPELDPDDKVERLDQFEASLIPDARATSIAKAARLKASLDEAGVTDRHARDLLVAFRMDAKKLRYRNWQELLDYCEVSANPVGRFLLDIHRENPAGYPASDALCTVLQILNHLQDCGDDRRGLDRIYIPADFLAEAGTSIAVLDSDRSDAGFRIVLDRMLDGCDTLLAQADSLPDRLRDTRFAINASMIVYLARRLAERLRSGDPLAERVALTKADFAVALFRAVIRGLFRQRPARAVSSVPEAPS
ncbi:MAG: squalene synthase HpnC [Pseudomonadota bacterium]